MSVSDSLAFDLCLKNAERVRRKCSVCECVCVWTSAVNASDKTIWVINHKSYFLCISHLKNQILINQSDCSTFKNAQEKRRKSKNNNYELYWVTFVGFFLFFIFCFWWSFRSYLIITCHFPLYMTSSCILYTFQFVPQHAEWMKERKHKAICWASSHHFRHRLLIGTLTTNLQVNASRRRDVRHAVVSCVVVSSVYMH